MTGPERLYTGRDYVDSDGDIKHLSDLTDEEYDLNPADEPHALPTDPAEIPAYINKEVSVPVESDLSVWQPRDKSRIMREKFGIDPWSARERGEAIESLVGGTARHLNVVLTHQKKNTAVEDPARALRSIVSEYGNFAREAKGEAGFLGMALEELDDLNPEAKLDTYSQLNEAGARRVSVAITRRLKANEFLNSDDLPDPLDRRNATNQQLIAIEGRIKDLSIGEIKKNIKLIIASEGRRQKFWMDRLKEAESHMAVTKLARAVLANLANRPPEV